MKTDKKGVLMINTSHGEIIDTNALIEGIENGIIGGAGIDSFENEQEVIHIDHNNVTKNRDLLILKVHPNVIVTLMQPFIQIKCLMIWYIVLWKV